MHPEIEKLIDIALADGQITEKERNVILKKATELGVDADEVDMVLDGKLHQLVSNRPKQKEKLGNIQTCPACGSTAKVFSSSCDSCGHEFRLDSLNSLTKNIMDDVNSLNKISNTPIPLNKEAIVEFVSFSISNVKNKGLSLDIRWAWHAKMEESFLKAEEVLGINEYEKFKLKYEEKIDDASSILNNDTPKSAQQIKEEKQGIYFAIPGLILGVFMIYLMVAGLAKWLGGAHMWPF